MNAGKAIYYLLSNATSVTDICGTRIYPELAEQEAPTPFVVYEVISVDPDDTNDGPAKLDEVTIDITAVADVYDTCADLASAIRAAIDRIRGTYNGVNVDSVQYSTTDTDVMDSPRRYAMTAKYIVRISRDLAQIATGQPIDLLTILRLADTPSTYGATGQALVMNAEGDALEWGETAGALGDLGDVNLSDLQDHEALVYDQDTATWINGASTKLGIRVINQTGVTLFKASPVRAVGVQGDQVKVDIFRATDDPKYFIGMLADEIANGETGYARQTGMIYGLDTSNFEVGDILYPRKEFVFVLGGDGLPYMVNERPVDLVRLAKIPAAIVVRKHANTGRVYVRTWSPGFSVADLRDVVIVDPQPNQVLRYDSSNQTWTNNEFLPSLNDLRDVDVDNPENIPNKSLLRWDASVDMWRVIPETGGSVPALPNTIAYFLGRYNDEATTARQAADATLTIERYLSVQGDGHGEELDQQSDTPSTDNKIVRKIWHKANSFEEADVTTWTLVHTFDDDTTYTDTLATFAALLTESTYGTIPFTLAQTWEDAPALTGLLDGYTDDLVGAFAPVLLVPGYEGACLRVRRSGDNAEQDIGFDGQDLDRDAIANFCSPGDGFVVTWYNQDGSGLHATQSFTSRQAKIYDASTGILTNTASNIAAYFFDALAQYITTKSVNNAPAFIVSVAQGGDLPRTGASGRKQIASIASVGLELTFWGDSSNTVAVISDGSSFAVAASSFAPDANAHILSVNYNGSSATMYQDGAIAATTSTSLTNSGVIAIGDRNSDTMYLTAVVIYSADKSADRAAIETALNSYFNIY